MVKDGVKQIPITRCDACGCAFPPDLEAAHPDDGVEINFFRCPYCRKQYMVSVTDLLTRTMISGYEQLSEREAAGRLEGWEKTHMEKLRTVILEHGRQLMRQYQDWTDGGLA